MTTSFYAMIKEELQSSARPIYETLIDSIQKMVTDGLLHWTHTGGLQGH